MQSRVDSEFGLRRPAVSVMTSFMPTSTGYGPEVSPTSSIVGCRNSTSGQRSPPASTTWTPRLSFGINAILGADNDDKHNVDRKLSSSEAVPFPVSQQQYGSALAAAALAAIAGRAYLFSAAAAAAAGLHGNQHVLSQPSPMMMMSPTGVLQLAAAQQAIAAATMVSRHRTEQIPSSVRSSALQLQQLSCGEKRPVVSSSSSENDDNQHYHHLLQHQQQSLSSFGDGLAMSPQSPTVDACDGSLLQSSTSTTAIFPWMQERKDRLCGKMLLTLRVCIPWKCQ